MDKYDLNDILEMFRKIKIVRIIIEEKDAINSQKIFESINSTGLELTNFDLIRNYILMAFDDVDQEEIYYKNWKPFEEKIHEIKKKSTDKVIRVIIQFLNKDYVKENEIYTCFKKIFENDNSLKIINRLNYALDLYRNIFYENDNEIEKCVYNSFIKLEPNNNELYATIFMILLDKYQNELISLMIYNESIKILSEYILRRKIADLDTSSITKFFNETLIKKIKNENLNIAIILKNELFCNNKNTQMFAPNNNEIKNKLTSINFYNLKICKVFFWYIENWNNPVSFAFKNLTIEHIAPQSPLKGDWIKTLEVNNEEEYQEKINLLGNLTIITDIANKKLSNDGWSEKKNKLLQYRHLKINNDIIEQEKFNIEFILKRQEKLVDDFFNIFA